MKKNLFMLLGAGTMAFTACTTDTSTTEKTTTTDMATDTNRRAATVNEEEYYLDRANRMSQQVSQDLKLDSATQDRLNTVYYNRAKQVDEMDARYNSADNMAANNENSLNAGDMDVSKTKVTRTPEYYTELEKINTNTDAEMRGFLSADQFKLYNTNRKKYYDLDLEYIAENMGKDGKYKADGVKIKRDGDELKIKTDDMKLKKDGDETKLKTDDVKIKKDGDESKLKTDDIKIKRESDEMKVKTDDSKIKVEN